MRNQEWMDLGEKIQNLVQDAVKSRNYQELNRTIHQTINKTVSQAVKKSNQVLAKEPPRQRPRPPVRYKHVSGEQMKAYMMAITGGILVSGTSLGILAAVIGYAVGHANGLWAGAMAILGTGDILGMILLTVGINKAGFLKRFRAYQAILADKTYCEFEKFAQRTGKSVKFIKKDIRKMLGKGWFLEGHMDLQETCLITSNETYSQYEQLQRRMRQKEEREEILEESLPAEAREILKKGERYRDRLQQCRQEIDQPQMTEKICHMEVVVQKIFERLEEHPEVLPDLKQMMDYYLPTTVKLLEAYEELEEQPVQGDNIASARKEIEETLDTLVFAFEKLLDSIFQDTAWDISSDISVLHTMLAQEGLTENVFAKPRKGENV